MKKSIRMLLLSLVFFAALCIVDTPVYAQDGDIFTVSIENDKKEGGPFDITFKVISEAEKTVQLGTGVEAEANLTFQGGLTIPATVQNGGETYDVVKIAEYAFNNETNGNLNITSIKGESVTDVGMRAFRWSGLTAIDLPKATTIGEYTFSSCAALTTINLPEATTIGSAAFFNCIALKTISLPKATTIRNGAFDSCIALGTISLPEVEIIELGAFNKCALTAVDLPELTTVGDQAFNDCAVLTTINLPKATTVEWGAFANCITLTSINLPKAVTIEPSAFEKCEALTTISLPEATTIGASAFRKCIKLNAVDLPKVTTIGGNAFSGCVELTAIDLPKATTIEPDAFYNCATLATINLPEATTIELNAFYGCVKLTAINLPKATTIGQNAFNGCVELAAISLPEVTTIGGHSFYGCVKLTAIGLPKATTIGLWAFDQCTALTTMVLGMKENNYTFEDIREYPEFIYLPGDSTLTDLTFDTTKYVAAGKGQIKRHALNITGSSKIESRPGAQAELTVSARVEQDMEALTKEITYQWQKKTDETWTDLADETGATLTFAALTLDQLGTYRCQMMPKGYPFLPETSSEAQVTMVPLAADFAASTITGIEEGKAYTKGDVLTFTVNGAGMDNNNPYEGDTRYIPVSWEVNPSGTFTDKYTATVDTKDVAAGKHKLQVTFDKQQYTSGEWKKTGSDPTIYTKSVNFTLGKGTNSWTTPLSMEGWTYGEAGKSPAAVSLFGRPSFTYSDKKDGSYTEKQPKNAGTWYVKASVTGMADYNDIESVVSFVIAQKDIAKTTISSITTEEDLKKLTIKDGDTTLEKDKDYTVQTETKDKKVIVNIAGKGNYNGTVTKEYTVAAKAEVSPQTGDASMPMLLCVIMLFSGCVLLMQRNKAKWQAGNRR